MGLQGCSDVLGGFGVCPSAAPSPGAREADLCKGPVGGTSRTAPSRSVWGCHPWRLHFYEPLLKLPSSQASACCQDLTHTPLGAGKVNRTNPLTGRGHPQSGVRGPGLHLQTQEVFSACSAGWVYEDQRGGGQRVCPRVGNVPTTAWLPSGARRFPLASSTHCRPDPALLEALLLHC